MAQNLNENIIPTIPWKELFKPIKGLKVDIPNRITIQREVIPIIFVPGIMGSRLINSAGERVWDPDDKLLFMAKNYGLLLSSVGRKELLIGKAFSSEHANVDNNDAKHNKKFASFTGADKRGWGGISWESYSSFLTALQNHEWAEPIRHCFELPVHAFGYNWTDTNEIGGKALSEEINKVMKQYADADRECKKVILVTHSMGGLTARSACLLHEAKSKVLGVIHGVQPALGSAAAYWRIKAGWERPAIKDILGYAGALVLGKNGEAVTMLLANMPGGLELLPNKLYTDNHGSQQWLTYSDIDGKKISLPKSDPYVEIYQEKEKFYRLVEPDWLNPGAKKKKTKARNDPAWDIFIECLNKAEQFHERLKDTDGIHPETVQFYATDLPTADRIEYKREIASWTNEAKRMFGIVKSSLPLKTVTTGVGALYNVLRGAAIFTPGGIAISAGITLASAGIKDSDWWVNRGGFRTHIDELNQTIPENDNQEREITFLMTLLSPDGTGDGTVPDASASVLKTTETVAINNVAKSSKLGHEPIYGAEVAQRISFAAIENLCLKRIKEEVG